MQIIIGKKYKKGNTIMTAIKDSSGILFGFDKKNDDFGWSTSLEEGDQRDYDFVKLKGFKYGWWFLPTELKDVKLINKIELI